MIYSKYQAWIEDNLKIVNKAGDVVPFNLNPIQHKFVAEDSVGRDLILKARQQGFSSVILGIFTADFILKENSRSVVVADIDDNSSELLDRVKKYIAFFEESNKTKVPLKYNSKNELYNSSNGARYTIGTAKNSEFGRSKTITNLHLCVGENTKVITRNGLTKAMKDVEVGDTVISADGSRTEVVNKWETGIKPMKKIRLWLSNETIEVSPEHKIMVMGYKSWSNGIFTVTRRAEPVWKQAKDLTSKDYVLWSFPKTGGYVKFLTVKKQKNCIHLVPNSKIKIANQTTSNFVVKTDYTLGYFLGYYLAEGHIDKMARRVVFACHKDEVFYKKFSTLFPIEPTIRVRADKTGTRKIITYNSREIAQFVLDLVGRVEDKHIPDRFLYHFPKKFLLGLYEGWKDGDGSKFNYKWKNIAITTVRESIARQMRQVYALLNHRLLALDFKEDRYRYGIKTNPVYILREHGAGRVKNNGRVSKKGRQFHTITRKSVGQGYIFAQVKSVEDAPSQNTYEIEVAHPSHAFLTVCGVVSNSEFAFYPDSERLLASAVQAVPDTGRIVIETTANGFNYFKEFWDRTKLGETGYKAHFYGASAFYEPEFLEKKKQELHRLYKQEYPDTDLEAFLSSGDLYFDSSALEGYLGRIKSPERVVEYV